jgi:hypothetical protein
MNERGIAVLLILGFLFTLLGYMLRSNYREMLSNARENQKLALQTGQRLDAEAEEWIASMKERGLLTVESSIILKADEVAYYEAPSALYETGAVLYSTGGGLGFRVAEGVYLGGGGARSLSEQEWTQLDAGMLTVTNTRLVFSGAKADRVVPLKKIVSANSASLSQVKVTAEDHQTSMLFDAANPVILANIVDLLARRAS